MLHTRALWRLDEVKPEQRPIDAIGAVAQLYQSPIEFGTPDWLRRAIGWGNWQNGAGWHFNEASGNLSSVFGSLPLTATGLTYGNPGVRGSDTAIGFSGIASKADGGNVLDVGAADDLIFAGIVRTSVVTGNHDIAGKGYSTGPAGWLLAMESASYGFYTNDGAGHAFRSGSGVPLVAGALYGIIGAYSRALGQQRFATVALATGSTDVSITGNASAVGTFSNAITFRFGDQSVYRAGGTTIVDFWISKGPNVEAALIANLSTGIANFGNAIMSVPQVVDAAAGRGRSFVALSGHGFEGADINSGDTLLTRNCSVQALVRWDLADQGGSMLWSLTKQTGAAAWDAGTSSVEKLAGDGYVEFVAHATAVAYMLGLSATDTNVDWATIDYKWYLDSASNTLRVSEGSTAQVVNVGTYAVGDLFRVERIGTTIRYYQNGALKYTSLVPSSSPLLIDSSLFTLNAGPDSIRLVDAGVRRAITWQNIANVTPTPAENLAGTLYARGKATTAAEYLSAGVELRVANASQGVGELRWLWMTSAGTLKRQLGGYFAPPTDGSYILLTATRRWVSSTSVILRYFLGDRLIAEIETADGDIGGGTTGTTSLGARFDGTKWGDFLDGIIDELRIVDYELTPEEVEATWKRISIFQPRGYRAIRDLLPPDAPISNEPTSRIQKLLNLAGNAVGYAAAQVENMRQNLLPDRAYGATLEQWEGVVKEPPKSLDSVDTRRARVLGHLRQKAGFSVPGLKAALSGLVATSPDNLQMLTFGQELVEGYNNAEQYSFDLFRTADSAAWTPTAGLLSLVGPAAAAVYDNAGRNWITADQSVSHSDLFKINTFQLGTIIGTGLSAHLLTKIAPTTIPSKAEVGVAFHDWNKGHSVLFGLRNNAGTYQIVTERFIFGISQGVTVRATTALQAHWLHLYQDGPQRVSQYAPNYFGSWSSNYWDFVVAWSTTGLTSGYTTYNINGSVHPSVFQWASLYFRTFDVGGSTVPASTTVVDFDDTRLFTPFGERPFRFYAYRDPALAGTPDVNGAHNVIQGLKQAQASGTLVTSKSVICDGAGSVCDRGCIGGF